MIQSTNIGTVYSIRTDAKKGKKEVITKYTPIGVIDDQLEAKDEEGMSKFS